MIVALLGALGLSGYLLKSEIEARTKVEIMLESTQTAYRETMDQFKTNITELNTARDQTRNIALLYSKNQTQLNQLKGRSDVVKAKPKLVANRINISFDGLLQDIQCATGDRSSCGPSSEAVPSN